jgi:hypothetical protein
LQFVPVGVGHVVALVPGQKAAGVYVDPLHFGPAHMAVEFRHLPVPSQTLVTPQAALLLAPQRVSVVLPALGWQVPLPSTLQALHAVQLALLQQTPSTQLPLLHWLPAVQASPGPLRLQLFVPPTPGWQVLGAWQSSSVVQDVRQAFAAQTNGMQGIDAGGAQLPAPSQCETGLAAVLDAQPAVPHETLVGCCWHLPLPSQVPVLPQVVLGMQPPCGSAEPIVTLAQVPALPWMLHAWQVPHDGLAQQTPSTQVRPLAQSALAEQLCPWWCRPHWLVIVLHLFGDRQSWSPVQLVLQAVVPLHRNVPQLVVVAVWQVPLPSQVRALVCVELPAGHLDGTQMVPAAYFSHAPLPLHLPSLPHVAAVWSVHPPCGSLCPAPTLVQVPAVLGETLHDLQVPLQLVEQQTPWLQKPDLHSLAAPQVWPFPFRPQDPFEQVFGGSQSLLLVQAALQAPEPHTYGKHELEAGFTQVPAPSQVELPVKVTEPLGQVAEAHLVPLAYFWQAPAWHLPLLPQLAAPWSVHLPAGSALPVATLVQVPSVPDSAHDWQAPAQALLQQTPWAQKPLLHWSFDEQLAPLPALPHELEVQRLGDTHWLSAEQALKHLLPLQVYGLQASVSGVTQRPAPSQLEGGV